jgi:hypothetical protein
MMSQSKEYGELIRKHQINIKSFYALPIWTSDLLYKQTNNALKTMSGDITVYKLYLKYIEQALKLLPSQKLIVYRGYKEYRQPEKQPGEYIFWPTVNSTSDSKEVASSFSSANGTLFTIHAKHAKSIHLFSVQEESER